MDKQLIKFLNKEHALEMYNNGTIFMGSCKYYSELEEENGIGDKYENSYVHFHLSNERNKSLIKKIGSNYTDNIDKINSLDIDIYDGRNKGNIFCMTYCNVDKEMNGYRIDNSGIDCYDSALLVSDNNEFINRIIKAGKKNGLRILCHKVIYCDFDEAEITRINPFVKRKKYSAQKEFRFFVERDNPEPLILNIGSLKDISIIGKIN